MSEIVRQIGGGGDEVFVVFVELTPGYGGDDDEPRGRRHSYTAVLYRRADLQGHVTGCGHEHREQHTAERCGRRLLRDAKKGGAR